MISVMDEGWCPSCLGYVRPKWLDGGYGTVEYWGTRIRHENKIPVCPWCGEELMEEEPKEAENEVGE